MSLSTRVQRALRVARVSVRRAVRPYRPTPAAARGLPAYAIAYGLFMTMATRAGAVAGFRVLAGALGAHRRSAKRAHRPCARESRRFSLAERRSAGSALLPASIVAGALGPRAGAASFCSLFAPRCRSSRPDCSRAVAAHAHRRRGPRERGEFERIPTSSRRRWRRRRGRRSWRRRRGCARTARDRS